MPLRYRGRILFGALLVGLVASWVVAFRAEYDKRHLASSLNEAQTSVSQLESERFRLEQELAQVSEIVDGQDAKINVLQAELTDLQGLLGDAEQEIARLRTEHTSILARNDELTGALSESDQERAELRTKLSSIKELKAAIHVVRRQLRDQRRQVWLAKIDAQRARDQQLLASGNRGYVVRNGSSTLAAVQKLRPRLQVRVLEPQAE